MTIPYHKLHGAGNDFLLTAQGDLPPVLDLAPIARAICNRYTGVGADGWMLVSKSTDGKANGAIELWNSDGSRSEISGNGTRCAAALLVSQNLAGNDVHIATGAGLAQSAWAADESAFEEMIERATREDGPWLMAMGAVMFRSTGIHPDGQKFKRDGRATVTLMRETVGSPWICTHSHISLKPGTPGLSHGSKPEKV